MKCLRYLLFVLSIYITGSLSSQVVVVDSSRSLTIVTDTTDRAIVKDTIKVKKDTTERHSARKATLRSALIPGWGQAYNKEYWKIPLVYGVVGVPAGFFIYNNTWYKRTKKAFEIRVTKDSVRFPEIHEDLENLNEESLRFYRNEFRRNRDYSILYFLIAWGLQVADATVFAHLKDFDVSEDLSFQIKPGYSPTANTSGISFVLAVKNTSKGNTFSR